MTFNKCLMILYMVPTYQSVSAIDLLASRFYAASQFFLISKVPSGKNRRLWGRLKNDYEIAILLRNAAF